MGKVIDVDKIMAWITANQRDEVIATPVTTQPAAQPAPTVVTQPTVAPAPSGIKGSKTNPFKINKATSLIGNGYIPENSPNDSRGVMTIPPGSKVYFEIDPVAVRGRPVPAFALSVKFYGGAGAVCKLTQDKATGTYSPEVCAGYSSFMELVYDGQPNIIANKKFLYAIDNSGSDGVANDEIWATVP
jgi:hypothetical protein